MPRRGGLCAAGPNGSGNIGGGFMVTIWRTGKYASDYRECPAGGDAKHVFDATGNSPTRVSMDTSRPEAGSVGRHVGGLKSMANENCDGARRRFARGEDSSSSGFNRSVVVTRPYCAFGGRFLPRAFHRSRLTLSTTTWRGTRASLTSRADAFYHGEVGDSWSRRSAGWREVITKKDWRVQAALACPNSHHVSRLHPVHDPPASAGESSSRGAQIPRSTVVAPVRERGV